VEVAPAMNGLAARLEEVARAQPEQTAKLGSGRRSLERLAKSSKDPGEVEASLARLDRRLCN
jgi:hypothetical protein